MKKMLTIKETAKRLGVSRIRVQKMIEEGKIKAHRFGWAYAIQESQLSRWHKIQHGTRLWLKKKTHSEM